MSSELVVNQEAENFKKEIIDFGQEIIAATDLSPRNDNFHQARYKLFDLATKTVSKDIVRAVESDQAIRNLIKQIFPISCEAGIHEECFIASELLKKENLTFGHIFRNYHGDIYEALMNDELDFLEVQENINMQDEHIAYIGGGAMPIPAMLLAQRTGCKVTIIDPHGPSCDVARNLIKRIGLDHLVTIVTMSGQAYDYSDATLAITANWIPDKLGIFARLAKFDNLKFIIFRSAAEETLSFVINDKVRVCDVCSKGLDLLHTTKKRDDISLVSLILQASKRKKDCLRARPCAQNTRIVDHMTDLIGNTPMLRLDPEKTGLKNIQLYAKLEHLNPFGSIKDRTAWGMLKPHIKELKEKNKSILELSSGNAARGLQAIASIHGIQLETVSNRIRVSEMREMLQLQGAKITPMPDSVDSGDAYAALEAVDERAEQEKDTVLYTDQYRNPNNDGTHYSGTGKEILQDLGFVDYFIGSVGTAGSTIGTSRRLKEANPDLDITGVISEKEDYVPGIRHKDEIFNVGPFKEDYYARLIDIDVQQAIDGILELTRDYGVMAGPSSGATYMAAMKYLREIDASLTEQKTAVFIVCDRAEMYFSWLRERRPDLFEF